MHCASSVLKANKYAGEQSRKFTFCSEYRQRGQKTNRKMLLNKLNFLLLAIGCTTVWATAPSRLENQQISDDIQQTEWKFVFDEAREVHDPRARGEKSVKTKAKLNVQMVLMKKYETKSLDGLIESNENESYGDDISDELPDEFNEINSGSEETEPIDEDAYDELNAHSLFAKFKIDYNRQYATAEEHAHRFNVFKQTLLHIQERNSNPNGTATYGITQFADLTAEEFHRRSGAINDQLPPFNATIEIRSAESIPPEFDWRNRHVISRVKNQGICGSCWAFTAAGAIEAVHALKTNEFVEFSEQQLVDCVTACHGCKGGDPYLAYESVHHNGGLATAKGYPRPYVAKQEKCDFKSAMAHARVSGAHRLSPNEQIIAETLVNQGPIAMGINSADMKDYHGGIADPTSAQCPGAAKDINHYVLAVGYGVGKDKSGHPLPYWILKNSWGEGFGGEERGYYKIRRGSNSCGVSQFTSYVVLA